MAYLKRPQAGQKALQSIYDSVISILDYLPTLTVRGDNNSTYVEHSAGGTIIHAKQNVSPDQTGQGGKYYAGSGIAITSGNFINALLSAGPNIHIDYNDGYFVISGTPAGSGGSGGTPPSDGRFNTIGTGNSVNSTLSGSGIVAANLGLHTQNPPPNYYITINETATGGYNLISCDLTRLNQLYNYDLVTDVQASVGYVNTEHYVRAGDLFLNSSTGHRGLGTQISLFRHSVGNTVIDPQTGEQHLVNPIMGIKVDLTVSGGNWISVSAVQRQVAGFDVDPEELEINCLLTGTYDHYPHTSGFIDIVPTLMEDGKTWGVISTNLHGDGTTIDIDPKDGTISCKIGAGNVPTPVANTVLSATSNGTMQWTANTGGGGAAGGITWPIWENLCGSGNIVLVKTWYTTSTGGWLRISNKTGTTVEGCNSIYIDPAVPATVDGVQGCGVNHIGLGTGINSHFLPVPPGSSFYIEYPSGAGTRCWFDGSTSPNKVTEDDLKGPEDIVNYSASAVAEAGVAETGYNNAYAQAENAKNDWEGYFNADREWNVYDPSYYRGYYWGALDAASAALTAATAAENCYTACNAAYTKYTGADKSDYQHYVTEASNAATSARNWATSAEAQFQIASAYYDLCYDHYMSCDGTQGKHPEHIQWRNDNPYFQKYGRD